MDPINRSQHSRNMVFLVPVTTFTAAFWTEVFLGIFFFFFFCDNLFSAWITESIRRFRWSPIAKQRVVQEFSSGASGGDKAVLVPAACPAAEQIWRPRNRQATEEA